MAADCLVHVAPELAAIVAAPCLILTGLVVTEADPVLDAPLRAAADRLRPFVEPAAATAAVRAMYKRVGLDPTRTRPSSEALLRRVRRGDEIPRINSLVDIVNWCSLESQLPFGLYDRGRVDGEVTLRLGAPGEAYAGIRKDIVHVGGRLTLADRQGAFGNPTSDSARTMVTTSTTAALVVVFAPAALVGAAAAALETTHRRAVQYCRR